jgi:Putative porin
MKKIKRPNPTKKIALFASVSLLIALSPKTYSQSAVDALLNKLEQKGILTVDEAKELKAENAQDSAADFDKAFNSKFPMPDWITSYKLSGDFRGRFDDVSADTPFTAGHDNNIRLRYRLRAGLTINMKDDLQVGFRLGTSDSPGATGGTTGGNPLSNNTTLQANGSKKFIYVDAAYGKWKPVNNDTWMVAATIGKMDQPFQTSPMVFDPDYTPEGGALQATYRINGWNSLAFNGAAFVLDQVNTRGPFLYGGQVIWNGNWTPAIGTSFGIAAYDIANNAHFAAGATPYDSNLGNTISGGTFASDFNPVVVSGSVTYTLDSFPLYPGSFPIKLAGEYMNNPAADSNNQGWWVGVTFGKSGKKGAWDLSYRYQQLEADAWWDQIVDDDNVALFPTSATTGSAAGGTNIRGHLVKVNYSIFDSLTFSFTCYVNDLINNTFPGTKTDAMHAMADLMWKF